MSHPPRLDERAAGVLLHPTSLPGPHGIGDLGGEARRFADRLAAAGQRWWQMLPIGPIGAADSPYHARSAFAGEPLLLSLESLHRQGLLAKSDLEGAPRFPSGRVDYDAAREFKSVRFRKAYERFEGRRTRRERAGLERFREENAAWAEDFALYCALARQQGTWAWSRWPEELRRRRHAALARARSALAPEIRYHLFLQLQFEIQWEALRRHCARRRVGLIGDLPIFVSLDSADVWSHPKLFHLDRGGRPTVVAGVPPDYFSASGQLWGNPHYRWPALRRTGYRWWIDRLRETLHRFDALRLDHFIGFERYWEVPARARTARGGRWRPGPGEHFFSAVLDSLGEVPIIAEDLGTVTPEVVAMRERFRFPGMRVLQFAFGSDDGSSEHLPHHHPKRCVAYTGTHDNDTAAGWYEELRKRAGRRGSRGSREELEYLRRYTGCDGAEMHWQLVRLAHASPAALAIVPLQDLLGLGSEARMNRPGTSSDNWIWRAHQDAFGDRACERLRRLTRTFGRLPQPAKRGRGAAR